ncbi:MAG: hypothetical protein QM820_04435 [Minicystis sp.]
MGSSTVSILADPEGVHDPLGGVVAVVGAEVTEARVVQHRVAHPLRDDLRARVVAEDLIVDVREQLAVGQAVEPRVGRALGEPVALLVEVALATAVAPQQVGPAPLEIGALELRRVGADERLIGRIPLVLARGHLAGDVVVLLLVVVRVLGAAGHVGAPRRRPPEAGPGDDLIEPLEAPIDPLDARAEPAELLALGVERRGPRGRVPRGRLRVGHAAPVVLDEVAQALLAVVLVAAVARRARGAPPRVRDAVLGLAVHEIAQDAVLPREEVPQVVADDGLEREVNGVARRGAGGGRRLRPLRELGGGQGQLGGAQLQRSGRRLRVRRGGRELGADHDVLARVHHERRIRWGRGRWRRSAARAAVCRRRAP